MKIKSQKNIILLVVFFVLILSGLQNVFAKGLNINVGTLTVNDGSFHLDGDLTVTGSLTASSLNAITIKLSGTWTASANSFTAGSSTVDFIGTSSFITGTNTFYNLTKSVASSTLTFGSGTTQTIQNTLTLNGTGVDSSNTQFLSLRSSESGVQFLLNVVSTATASLSWLDVKDSKSVNGILTASNSNDTSNNTNWTITAPSTPPSGGSSDGDGGGGVGGGGSVNDFTAQPTSGAVPLAVSFTDISTGSISRRSWDFGDGNSLDSSGPSGGISVSHTYTEIGTYTVSLLVTRSSGNETVSKSNLISAHGVIPVSTPISTPVVSPTPTPVPSSGSISGNVVDASGGVINGIKVDAFKFEDGSLVTSSRTNETGFYLIDDLVPGDYSVGVDVLEDSFNKFAPQFFDNVASKSAASVVKVLAGSNTASIDFRLVETGIIRGMVTDSTEGVPLAGVTVEVFDASSQILKDSTLTDTTGVYSIPVEPGSYKVGVNTFGTDFLPIFFDNVRTIQEAQTVEVAIGKNAESVNFVLSKGSFISGKIVDGSGVAIPGLFVNVFDDKGTFIRFTDTDAQGNYSVQVLPGTYELVVDVSGTIFSPPESQFVTVDQDKSVSDINFVLLSTSIKGVVTNSSGVPQPDLFVDVADSVSGNSVSFAITEIDGSYFVPVTAGEYIVSVNVSGTNFKPVSKEVTVTNVDVQVDFTLEVEQTISGKISDNSGLPIEGMVVNAFDFNTGFWAGMGITNADGNYSIPVVEGGYKVVVDVFGTDFKPVVFDNSDWDNATEVLVVKGENSDGVDFVLGQASFIAGIITDGVNPLSEIPVDVFSFDTGTWINFEETGEGGTYSVSVREGSYKVGAIGLEQGFSNEFFDDKDVDDADKVDVQDGEIKGGIDFVLDFGGSISGVVSSGEKLLDGIEVNVFSFESDLWINGTTTTTAGVYEIDGLPGGKYIVWAFDPEAKFSGQFFDSVRTKSSAVVVNTVNGEEVTGVDFNLEQGGFVNGKVTDKSDIGQNSITVEAYELGTGQWINSIDTDSSGDYSIVLPAGDYNLRAVDIGGTFTAQYYDGAASINESESVKVVDGEIKDDINFKLSVATSFIVGEVKDDRNKLLKGIKVDVFDFNSGELVNSSTTGKDGRYKVTVSEGSYRVAVIPENPGFTPLFYNNVSLWESSSPVNVSSGNSIDNINFRLATNGGVINGVVTDDSGNRLQNIIVQTFGFGTDQWANDDQTNGNGEFNMPVLPGRYRLRALPLDGSSNISSEYYDNVSDLNFAESVTVEAGETVTLNNIELITGRAMAGKVLDVNDQPVSGVQIDVYLFDSGSWVGSILTDKFGNYTVNGMAKGDYRVKASAPFALEFASQFYNNSVNWDGAKRVTIGSDDIEDIDFVLLQASLIAGKVLDDDNDQPVSGVEVDVFDFNDGTLINHDVTDGSGNYSVHVLPGVYMVRTTASGSDFIDEFFDNSLNINDAKSVIVSAGINGIADFRLNRGSSISGKVVSVSGEAIAGANVDVLNSRDSSWVNNDFTDTEGLFTVNVPLGVYRLKVTAPLGSDFIDKLINDAIEVSRTEEFFVNTITLNTGRAIITGTVQSDTIGLLEGVRIKVQDSETADIAGVGFTDIDGKYSISVPPGLYKVGAFSVSESDTFVTRYFNNALTWSSADEVTIVSNDNKNIDFTLATSFCISGRVIDAETLESLAGLKVNAFQFETGQWIASDKTDATGNYSICLANGTYIISLFASDFEPQFFSKTDDQDKSKQIILNGSDVTNVDFELSRK